MPGARFEGASHSVTDADGETDLLLRVVAGGERVGVLVENKISAPAQERQDERYHLRAARAQNAGRFDRFVVCICAPQAYVDGLPGESAYQAEVAYKDVSSWYSRSGDARSAWRRANMEGAVAQGRRGYRLVVNETVSRFHLEFREQVQFRTFGAAAGDGSARSKIDHSVCGHPAEAAQGGGPSRTCSTNTAANLRDGNTEGVHRRGC